MSDLAAMAWTLLRALGGTALLLLPGLLTAHALLPRTPLHGGARERDAGLHHLALAAAWAFGGVPSLCFFAFLLTGAWMSWATLTTTAVLNAIAAGAFLWRRDGKTAGVALLRDVRVTASEHRHILLAVVAVFALYLLRHDDSLPALSCLHPAALKAVGAGLRGGDLLHDSVYDVRLGNVGIVAAWDAMAAGFGYRWLLGLCGALLALGGYLLGRRAGGGRAWGWLGLVLLALNPWTLSFPRIDENLLTLALSAVSLPLLLRRPTSWLAAGALVGVLVTMRHVLILSLPAALLAATWSSHRWRALATFIVAFAAMTLLENLHHLLALGSLLRFESHGQFPPYAYEFFGRPFHWQGMLNWPLHDQVVRTPFNGLPTFALWPLSLAAHFGLLAVCIAAVGAFVGLRRRSRQTLFWLLWAAPPWLALSLQEAWDYQNKMGVLVIVLCAPVAWMVAGARPLLRRQPAPLVIAIVVLAGSVLALPQLRQWQPPADTRYLQQYRIGDEESAAARQAQATATDVHLWPEPGRVVAFGRFLDGAGLSALVNSLRDPVRPTKRPAPAPPWGWHRHELTTAGAPLTIEVDLSRPPWGRQDLVRVVPSAGDLNLTTASTVHLVQAMATPWTRQPLAIAMARNGGATAIQTFFGHQSGPGPDRAFAPCAFKEHPCSCEFFADVSGLSPEQACGGAQPATTNGPVLRLRTHAGALTLVVTANVYGNRGWLWRGTIAESGVLLQEPVQLWHN